MRQLTILFLALVYGGNCYSQQLGEMQVTGSHNSYKKAMDRELLEYLRTIDPKSALTLEYEHISVSEQLDMGIGALEFDVYYDPNGGHYSNPHGLDIVRRAGAEPLPYDNEKLKEVGFKLMHIQDLDFRTHHILFKDALRELAQWSERNPNHPPIFITMNTNDARPSDMLREAMPFTRAAYDSLDVEIREVLGGRLTTPDDVRKEGYNLEQTILEFGWGDIDKYRGTFIFVLDADHRSSQHAIYVDGNPSLEGRVFFTNSKEGTPSAAIRIVNDPINDYDYIRSLVERGYIVRTRADADTFEARSNDTTRLKKAIDSGAHIISTDYYVVSKFFESEYICPIL